MSGSFSGFHPLDLSLEPPRSTSRHNPGSAPGSPGSTSISNPGSAPGSVSAPLDPPLMSHCIVDAATRVTGVSPPSGGGPGSDPSLTQTENTPERAVNRHCIVLRGWEMGLEGGTSSTKVASIVFCMKYSVRRVGIKRTATWHFFLPDAALVPMFDLFPSLLGTVRFGSPQNGCGGGAEFFP